MVTSVANVANVVQNLIRVGDKEAARGESRCSLVDTSATFELLGALDALFSSESRIQLGVVSQLRALAKLQDIVAALASAASRALGASTCRIVCRAGRFVDELLLLLRFVGKAFCALRGAGQAGVSRGGAAS